MSTIPTWCNRRTIRAMYLLTVQRGYEFKIPFQLHLKTLAYWMTVVRVGDSKRSKQARKKEISWQAVYYHWQKWNEAGCFEQIWHHSPGTHSRGS